MAKDLSIQGSEATNTLAPTACLLYSIMPVSQDGIGVVTGNETHYSWTVFSIEVNIGS